MVEQGPVDYASVKIQSCRGYWFSGSTYFSKRSSRPISLIRLFTRNKHNIRVCFFDCLSTYQRRFAPVLYISRHCISLLRQERHSDEKNLQI